jgi:adenylate cyclase
VWNFDRADRHFRLAQAMNPSDALHHVFWGYYVKGMAGEPEEGITAIDFGIRLNPRHPRWYDMYRSRLLFLLKRYDMAAALLDQPIFGSPARDLRDRGWRAAALALAGRESEARTLAADLMVAIQPHWRGPPESGPSDYVERIVAASFLRQAKDEEHLRSGLRLAGLPA